MTRRHILDEAHVLSNRLRHTSIGDWLAADELGFADARLTMTMLRQNLIAADDKEGGFKLTTLGQQVRDDLREGVSS